jgi:hypothetical protein
MDYQVVKVDELLSDPDNYRRSTENIEELAASIEKYGLLHNLVCVVTSHGLMVKDGNRRLSALRLLRKRGKFDEEVLVLVLDSTGKYEQLIANLHREKVPPWQLGHRLLEMYEAGITQDMLASKIGWAQGKVSMHIKMARYLHPSVIARLDGLKDKAAVSTNVLLRMSGLYNPETFEPDEKAQEELLNRHLMIGARTGKRGPKVVSETSRVMTRYHKLKNGSAKVPGKYMRLVDMLLRYLNGDIATLEFDV